MISNPDHVRATKNRWKRKSNENVRELPEIPKPKNRRRRTRCKKSLRAYLLMYHKDLFELSFSPHHEKLIELIERAIIEGLQQAIGFPRGSGKTTLCQLAVLWSVLFGYRKHVKIFGCEEDASTAHLEEIKHQLNENELLLEDFPEVIIPYRATEGNSIRAKGQLYRGKLTNIAINSSRVILSTIPPAIKEGNAGAIISVATLTGAGARGAKVRGIRPDLALVDDPQTRKSASSRSLVKERISCLCGDVMGMAGPNRSMSCLVTCTVIKKDDLADQVLNRKKHPEWHGIRIKMLEEDPKDSAIWLEWSDICRRAYILEEPLDEAHQFYRDHRKIMDGGAQVYWEDRYEKEKGFVSAIEQAMFFKLVKFSPEDFASEYQNAPLDEQVPDIKMPSPEEIIGKAGGLSRWEIPLDTKVITAFIDVQQKGLWKCVVAWSNNFTGWVIDYGTFPEQTGRLYWTKSDMEVTLAKRKRRAGLHGSIRWGLDELILGEHGLANQEFVRPDDLVMKIEKGFVDANWGDLTDVVYSFMRDNKLASRGWMPSHGEYNRAAGKRLDERKEKPGETRGTSWKIDLHETHKIERVTYDTNWWKTFNCQRWSATQGDPGCMYLFRGKPLHQGEDHRIMGDHLNAEYGISVKVRDKSVMEWFEKPGRPDNEFLDGMVGNCVAASTEGITIDAITPTGANGRERKSLNSSNVGSHYR